MGLPPCLVIGTPRSRTAWLAEALSAPGRQFVHEPAVNWRGLDDLYRFLDRGGCASDSGLTLFWREAVRHRPDTRLIVVVRPPDDVLRSIIRAAIPIQPGLRQAIKRIWDAGFYASRHVHAALTQFDRLYRNSVCDRLYHHANHCDAPAGHFADWQPQNIQRDWREQFAAAEANANGFPALLRRRLGLMADAA